MSVAYEEPFSKGQNFVVTFLGDHIVFTFTFPGLDEGNLPINALIILNQKKINFILGKPPQYLVLPKQTIDEVTLQIGSRAYHCQPEIVPPTPHIIEHYLTYVKNDVISIVRSNIYHYQKIKRLTALKKSLQDLSLDNSGCHKIIEGVLSLWKQGVLISDDHLSQLINFD